MTRLILVALATASLCSQVSSLDNGLARTPPMGWLSWNRFMCEIDCDKYPNACINDKLYMAMADRMAEDGYKDVGYEYVNIDDCWSEMERDKVTGRLVPNATRFPKGIKGLADYVHSKGLKLGLYGDMGTLTCGGYPGLWNGSLSLFDLDATTFAEWGIDSLKVDGCYMADRTKDFDWQFPAFGAALNKTGRPILYSCEWPLYQLEEGIRPNYSAIARGCNVIRNYYDTSDSWPKILDVIDYFAEHQDTFDEHQGPGSFFDPDMVVVGNYGLSHVQAKAHMAWWALFSAPLLMANDLRQVSAVDKAILQNRNLIAVNQDALGRLGKRVRLDKNDGQNVEVWAKPMSDGGFVVAYFNVRAQGSPVYIKYKVDDIAPRNWPMLSFYKVLDLFANTTTDRVSGGDFLELLVEPSGGVAMARFSPTSC